MQYCGQYAGDAFSNEAIVTQRFVRGTGFVHALPLGEVGTNGPRSWRRPPHLPLCQAQAPQHRRQGALGDPAVMPRGPQEPPRSAPPCALPCSSPHRMSTRVPRRMYIMYPLVIWDNLAKHVGILRQLCKERKKQWEHVPPSCGVATSGRRGD